MRMYTVQVSDGDQRDPWSTVLQTVSLEDAIALVARLVAKEKFHYGVEIRGSDLSDERARYLADDLCREAMGYGLACHREKDHAGEHNSYGLA